MASKHKPRKAAKARTKQRNRPGKRPAAKAARAVAARTLRKPAARRRPAAKAAAKPSKAVKKQAVQRVVKKVAVRKVSVKAKAEAKQPAPKVTAAPVKTAPKLVAVSTQAKPVPSSGAKPQLQLVSSRPVPKPINPADLIFKAGDHVVYPTHGVGRVSGIETQEISGMQLTLFVVHFEKDKMTLRVPVTKANTVGMRRLSSPEKMRSALKTLKGRARIKRTMWSRRAQEYEAKINSGDPVSIAEVVRDLHRNAGQPEQSYSERQIYEAALDRLARELAAVERIDEEQAAQRLEKVLRAA